MRAKTDAVVLVFAKAPVPGEVKTRLIPLLGPAGAAELQRRMLSRAIRTALRSGVGPVELWCAPDSRHAAFDVIAETLPISLFPQSGADLGRRMWNAARAALQRAGAVLLTGADCPALTADLLRRAVTGLAHGHNAVLVPAADGGYVMLGLARGCEDLFEAIPWGGATVMADTRARLARQGWRWLELETLWDVDRPDDLQRLRRLAPQLLTGLC